MPHVTIYTDGSCRGTNGPVSFGGWAAVLICGDLYKEIFGCISPATSPRMELLAVIEALEALKHPSVVELTTDSEYVQLGITDWINKWKANGWKNAKRKPVLNQDLWLRLDAAAVRHQITWKWTRGHADNKYNNRCDEMATAASAALKAAA